MAMTCPLDGAALRPANDHGVPYAECPTCSGGWFDMHEFEELEATAGKGNALSGTIEYAERATPLHCPVDGDPMVAFDYRGEDLTLDACKDGKGFWLDGGASDRVRALMRERAQGLKRASKEEAAWNAERERGFEPTLTERLKHLLSGR
jgi:Zn-finger nucleic acid-binding protein